MPSPPAYYATGSTHNALKTIVRISFGFQQLAAFQFGVFTITQPLVVNRTHRHGERIVLYILVELADDSPMPYKITADSYYWRVRSRRVRMYSI